MFIRARACASVANGLRPLDEAATCRRADLERELVGASAGREAVGLCRLVGLAQAGRRDVPLGYGQATKGARWMPRQQEAKKDVDSCDKLRGAANRL